jgi:hypothetical protein
LLFFLLREKKPRERLILGGDFSLRNSGIHSSYMEEPPGLGIFTDFSPAELSVDWFGDGWRHVLSKE